MKLISLLLLYSSLLISSCNTKSTISNDEVEKIILEKYKNMRATLKSGDPNFVLNMHTQDAILFMQNGKEVIGIAALRPFYEKVATTSIDIKSTPTSIELLSENIAFEVGTFTSTSKTGVQNSAKYINIWKKSKGEWKLNKAIDQSKL